MQNTANDSLTPAERQMFSEIAQVMKRHPQVERRFNLALDHQHFPIAEDEVLCEENDPENRVLKSVVIKTDAIPTGALASQWSVDPTNITAVQFCWALGCG